MLNSDPAPPADRHHHPEPLVEELAEALPPARDGVGELAWRWVVHLLPFVLLAVAGVVLWQEFKHLSLASVGRSMAAWGSGRILAALALSATSFLLIGCIEWLGLRWAGARLPLRSCLAGSFIANGIAHTVGANLLVGGAVRARLYDRYGVGLTQVAATTLFGGMAFAVGISTLGGVGLLLSAPEQIAATSISLPVARALGAGLLLAVASCILMCAFKRGPLRAFGRTLTLPSGRTALLQLCLGVTDNATAAAIIWVLLPPESVPYHTFVGAYAVSTVAGLASTVPAGAGVFEGTMSALLRSVDRAPMAAAFLGYRLAFFILPLMLAGGLLALDTLLRRSRRKR